jgi:hypothetical protein
MAKILEAKYGTDRIGIEEALGLKGSERRKLRCMKCDDPLVPHKRSTNGNAAHFEHLPGSSCEDRYDPAMRRQNSTS